MTVPDLGVAVGLSVDSQGSSKPCISHIVRAMWAAFWRHLKRIPSCRALGDMARRRHRRASVPCHLNSGNHPVSSSADSAPGRAGAPIANLQTDSVDKTGVTAILRASNDRRCLLAFDAQVAELVDALASGASGH